MGLEKVAEPEQPVAPPIVVDAVILYPVQIATNLLAYETGYYSADDVRRMGLAMLLLTIVVVSVTILYWGWLALLLTA